MELKKYTVMMVVNNSDGDAETGMIEPEWFWDIVEATSSEEAKRIALAAHEDCGCTDVHESTEDEIREAKEYEEMYAAYEEEEIRRIEDQN